ncbi:proline rich protein [Seiridium cupressi]
MKKLVALALYAITPVFGFPQQSHNYRLVPDTLGIRDGAGKRCSVRTITILTTYYPAGATSYPVNPSQEDSVTKGLYATGAHDGYETADWQYSGGYNDATNMQVGAYPTDTDTYDVIVDPTGGPYPQYPNEPEDGGPTDTQAPYQAEPPYITEGQSGYPAKPSHNTGSNDGGILISTVTETFGSLTFTTTFTTSILSTLSAAVTSTATTASVLTTTVSQPTVSATLTVTSSGGVLDMLSIRRVVANAAAATPAAAARRENSRDWKRQDVESDGFVGTEDDPNPDVCTFAGLIQFLNGELIASGRTISVDPGVPFISLGDAVNGSISTDFSIQNSVLTWANPQFFGGRARFCQVGDELPVALFAETDQPPDCVLVDLIVYSSGQCQNGELIGTGGGATSASSGGGASSGVSTGSTAQISGSSAIVSSGSSSSSGSSTSLSTSTTSQGTLESSSSTTASTNPLQTFPIVARDSGTSADGLSLQPQSGSANSPAVFGPLSTAGTFGLDPVTGECAATVTGTLDCYLNATSTGLVYRSLQLTPQASGAFRLAIGTTVSPSNFAVTLGTNGLAGPSTSSTGTGSVTSTGTSSGTGTSTSPAATFPIFASDTGNIADGLQLQPQSNGLGSPAIFSLSSSPVTYSLDPTTGEVRVASDTNGNQDVCCTVGDASAAPLQCNPIVGGSGVLDCYLNASSIDSVYRTAQIAPLGDGTYRLEIGTSLGTGNSPVTLSTISPSSSTTGNSATGTSTSGNTITTSSTLPLTTTGSTSTTSQTSGPSSRTATSMGPLQTFPIFAAGTGTNDTDGLQLQPRSGIARSPLIFSSSTSPATYAVDPSTGVLLVSPDGNGNADGTQEVCCTYANGTTQLDPALCFLDTCALGGSSVAPLQCDTTTTSAAVDILNCYLNATAFGIIYSRLQIAPLGDGTYQLEIGTAINAGNAPVNLQKTQAVIGTSLSSPATSATTTSSGTGSVTQSPTTSPALSITSGSSTRSSTISSTGSQQTFSLFSTDTGTAADGLHLQPQSSGAANTPAIFSSTSSPVTYSLDPTTGEVLTESGSNPQKICCTYTNAGSRLDPAACSLSTCALGGSTTAPLQCGSLTSPLSTSGILSSTGSAATSGVTSIQSTSSGSSSTTSTTTSAGSLQTFPIFATGTGTTADGLQLQPQDDSADPLAIFGSTTSPITFGLDPTTGELLVVPADGEAVCCTYVIAGGGQDPAFCSISTCSLGGTETAPLQCNTPTAAGVLNCYLNATSIGAIYSQVQVASLGDGTFQLEVGTTIDTDLGNSPAVLNVNRPATGSSTSTLGSSTLPTTTAASMTTSNTATLSSTTASLSSSATTFLVFASGSGSGVDGFQLHAQSNNVNGAPAIFGTSTTTSLEYSVDPTTQELNVATSNDGHQDVCCTYLLPLGDGTHQLEVGRTVVPGNAPVMLVTQAPITQVTTQTTTRAISSTSQSSSSSTFVNPLQTFPVFASDTATIANGFQLQPQSAVDTDTPAIFSSLSSPVTYRVDPATSELLVASNDDANSQVCCTYVSGSTTLDPAPCSLSTCPLGDDSIVPLRCSLPSAAGVLSCYIQAASIGDFYGVVQLRPLADGTFRLEVGTALAPGHDPVTLLTFRPVSGTSSTSSTTSATSTTSSTAFLSGSTSITSATPLPTFPVFTVNSGTAADGEQLQPVIGSVPSNAIFSSMPSSLTVWTQRPEGSSWRQIIITTRTHCLFFHVYICKRVGRNWKHDIEHLHINLLNNVFDDRATYFVNCCCVDFGHHLLVHFYVNKRIDRPQHNNIEHGDIGSRDDFFIGHLLNVVACRFRDVGNRFNCHIYICRGVDRAYSAAIACGTDAPAYYIVGGSLIREDFVFSALGVVTAAATVPIRLTFPFGTSIDALGFNVLDGFLYATSGAAPSTLVQISTADGSSASLGSLGLSFTPVAGVVDENSQYWLTNAANTAWAQVNLVPGFATFGAVVASGTSAAPGHTVADWAWVPGTNGGNNLYGVGRSAPSSITTGTYLMRWNRSTHVWSVAASYLNVLLPANYQSVFAGQN